MLHSAPSNTLSTLCNQPLSSQHPSESFDNADLRVPRKFSDDVATFVEKKEKMSGQQPQCVSARLCR